MILSINDLIQLCVEQTNGTIPIKELMENYHLRWEDTGISSPVNDVTLDTMNKEIRMSFNLEKRFIGWYNE